MYSGFFEFVYPFACKEVGETNDEIFDFIFDLFYWACTDYDWNLLEALRFWRPCPSETIDRWC